MCRSVQRNGTGKSEGPEPGEPPSAPSTGRSSAASSKEEPALSLCERWDTAQAWGPFSCPSRRAPACPRDTPRLGGFLPVSSNREPAPPRVKARPLVSDSQGTCRPTRGTGRRAPPAELRALVGGHGHGHLRRREPLSLSPLFYDGGGHSGSRGTQLPFIIHLNGE